MRNQCFGHKRPIEPSEFEAILANILRDTSKHGLRNAALWALWWDSAGRIEDVCGLSVAQVAGKDTVDVVQGKVSMADACTGKRRKRPVRWYLEPRTVELVNRYIAMLDRSGDTPLFTSQKAKGRWIVYQRQSSSGVSYTTRVGVSTEQCRKQIKAWCAEIGIDPTTVSTHSVRRGRLTAMWRNGVRPKIIQLRAGHQDARSTIGYDSPTEDELRAA